MHCIFVVSRIEDLLVSEIPPVRKDKGRYSVLDPECNGRILPIIVVLYHLLTVNRDLPALFNNNVKLVLSSARLIRVSPEASRHSVEL